MNSGYKKNIWKA